MCLSRFNTLLTLIPLVGFYAVVCINEFIRTQLLENYIIPEFFVSDINPTFEVANMTNIKLRIRYIN